MNSEFYGESNEDIERKRYDFYEKRFYQLNSLVISSGEKVWTYLITVNGGGAVALLTLLGAVGELRRFSWPYISLGLFVFGLVLVGVHYAFWCHKAECLQKKWKSDHEQYFEKKLSWLQVVKNDQDRVKDKFWLPYLLGYLSFFCFLISLIISAIKISNMS